MICLQYTIIIFFTHADNDSNICLASEGPFKMWSCLFHDYNTVTNILLDNAYGKLVTFVNKVRTIINYIIRASILCSRPQFLGLKRC